PQSTNPRWVNYQCKYYKDPIAPSNIWEEIAKIIYYSYIQNYPIPTKYYFVAPKGVGVTLADYLANPETLKQKFIENWNSNWRICKSNNLTLDGSFKDYVLKFPFNIFFHKSQIELIEE